MTPTATNKVLRLADSAIFRKIDEQEAVLLDINSKAFFSLNPTGLVILERLKEGGTRDELLATVCQRFAVEERQCEADLNRFLDDLFAAGLLESS